jgi:hypothetical protein
VRRSVSFWESRIDLSVEQQAEIRKRLGDCADVFIDKATLAGGEYRHLATAWSGSSPAEVRQTIEKLGVICSSAAAAINALPEAAPGLIHQGHALDASNSRHPDLPRSTMGTSLERLKTDLSRIASACARAATFKALNPGRGNEPDYARRALIRQLAEAYKAATGKEPAQSSSGRFAAVARIILVAAGADAGISNDTLVSVLGASGNSA